MSFELYKNNIFDKIANSTEYTLRADLENLLNLLKPRSSIKVIHENKKIDTQDFGKPDFLILDNDLELGWIETKPFDIELKDYIGKPQLERYLSVIPNLLFTNYRDFILFRNGEIFLQSTLFSKDAKNIQDENQKSTEILLSDFFNSNVVLIDKTENLSKILARNAHFLRLEILSMWYSDDKSAFKERLSGLYFLFTQTLIEELTPEEFIDAYSQTVTYGLFLAGLNSNKKLDRYNFLEFIPQSLTILNEIFGLLQLSNIPLSISWIIDKVFIALNNTDFSQVHKELSFANKEGSDYEDPYIYFYENFLNAYNKDIRFDRGVFYTPTSIVNFIIRSVNHSLVHDFNKSGLDDSDVSVLDFATGTGTFLLQAYKTAIENVDKGQVNGFIRNHLLKQFFGFEFLIAPYTIAHLKLTQFLKEKGFEFKDEERIGVYLTDTLDDAHLQRNPLFPYISDEGEKATQLKIDEKLFVVLGNPPYSNFSINKKPFILNLIKDYKEGLSEKKINIDDDYIKFIRFAQAKIEGKKYSYIKGKKNITGEIKSLGQGIIGIITNNSYLSGVTHRQMRKSLLESFDKIYIINLHGNSNIGEPDKNIFDIKVGVSIAIFMKLAKPLKNKEVYYFSTLDNNLINRKDKENLLDNNNIDSINWIKLKPEAPYYWFVSKDFTHQTQYDEGWGLNKIFKIYNSGIKTDRDKLFIDRDVNDLETRMKKLLTNNFNKNFQLEFNINDSSSYKLTEKIKNKNYDRDNIKKIHYRPFDIRFIYYQVGLVSRPSFKVHSHFLDKENIGIIFPRFTKGQTSNYGFVVDTLVDVALGGKYTGSETYIAPLYIYNNAGDQDENGNGFLFKDEQKKDNFTKEFRKFLNENSLNNYSPEEILSYIYAIMYSKTYREKYFQFFKIDYPKIVFTKDIELFEKLSELGKQLVDNHLLKINYPKGESPIFAVDGDNKVDNYYFDVKLKRLFINKMQYFDNFSDEIWAYEIGGYQVFDKYLKARKGLILSYEEVNHIKKVASALSRTIEIQDEIDELCSFWI